MNNFSSGEKLLSYVPQEEHPSPSQTQSENRGAGVEEVEGNCKCSLNAEHTDE